MIVLILKVEQSAILEMAFGIDGKDSVVFL